MKYSCEGLQMSLMYDIHLSSACHTLPDLSDLAGKYPILMDAAFQARLLERVPKFLGLDMPKEDAIALWKRLESTWGRGMFVLSAYRNPKVTVEEAFPIAERAIARLQAEHCPNVEFNPVRFLSEDAMWWVFKASSEELIEQGFIPGALFALVDKLDGHVWQPNELEQFGEEHERLRYPK
jgi:hypothetical protein